MYQTSPTATYRLRARHAAAARPAIDYAVKQLTAPIVISVGMLCKRR